MTDSTEPFKTNELETPLLRSLNDQQKSAVQCLRGPLLILAGAGSGKTRVLTFRMAHLIASGEATPHQILAVTFTNKAAKEMGHRTVQLLQQIGIPVFEPMWISTFHSTCARILRSEIQNLGYQSFFAIYDDADQLSMIKKVLLALNINEKIHPPKNFQYRINQAKQQALLPSQITSKNNFLMDDKTLEVYRQYEEEMKKANALDFADLLLKTYILFSQNPEVLAHYQERFPYILVDEYQDTNRIQYLLVKMLAQEHRNLCVVGDEDQSIYSWRGADISNILSFEKDFPETQIIKLEQNYRSSQTIVQAATALIQNNQQRKGKVLFTQNEPGSLITVHEDRNEYEEARFVVERISGLMKAHPHREYRDFAVFYRTNAQSRVLEDLMRSYSLPYRLIGGVKFYSRKEVKDLVSYLRVLLNPNDDVAIKRIINVPTRGIGRSTIDRIEEEAAFKRLTFYEAIRDVAERRLVHAGATKKLHNFLHLLEQIKEQSQGLSLSQTYLLILDQTGYMTHLREENTVESQSRIENLEELSNAILQFEQERGEEAKLPQFLEEMALISDTDQMKTEENSITLMTLHVAKGLEFPVVFIVGLEEGLFPSSLSFDGSDNEDELEEERRLAYVGITRAREKLFLTYARSRRVWGQEKNHPPSRFLAEIPNKYIENTSSLSSSLSFLKRFQQNKSYNPKKPLAQHPSPADSRLHSHWDEEDNQSHPTTENDLSSTESQPPLKKGTRVRHPTFGDGSIFAIEGQGETQKVSVLFRNSLTKKFVVRYARLQILS